MAGNALAKALCWAAEDRGLDLAPRRRIGRDESVADAGEDAIVCIAGPHGLHVARLLEVRDSACAVICEKPAAVTLADIDALADYPRDVAVCHGYRMLWGPRTLRAMVQAGDLGELVAVEGRYWQCSAAVPQKQPGWKDDPALAGPHDTLVDLATHWLDMACYVLDDFEPETGVTLGYGNAASPHRDTHVLIDAGWGDCPGRASVSKTAHGCGNHLELQLIDTRARLAWSLERPEILLVASGSERRIRACDGPLRSGMRPYHGLGWMEGYVAIAGAVLDRLTGAPADRVPTLPESLAVTRRLLEGTGPG